MPPTIYYEGKVTFGVALIFIGFVTALIGDLATLFGCIMGLEPSVTAITSVRRDRLRLALGGYLSLLRQTFLIQMRRL